MDYENTIEIKEDSYKFFGQYQNRQGNEVIPLLIGGRIEIYYTESKEEGPWDNDNDHNGPQAA